MVQASSNRNTLGCDFAETIIYLEPHNDICQAILRLRGTLIPATGMQTAEQLVVPCCTAVALQLA